MATDRPEWASGPEWEGWEVINAAKVGRTMRQSDGDYLTAYVMGTGWLTLFERDESDGAILACKSTTHALAASNALAEAAGGWA